MGAFWCMGGASPNRMGAATSRRELNVLRGGCGGISTLLTAGGRSVERRGQKWSGNHGSRSAVAKRSWPIDLGSPFTPASAAAVALRYAGKYIDTSAYGITWGRAREAALILDEHALEPAKRPYDLRHAGISFWLASGVDPAECARRAGRSIPPLRQVPGGGEGSCQPPDRDLHAAVGGGVHGRRGGRLIVILARKCPAIAGQSWDTSGRQWE